MKIKIEARDYEKVLGEDKVRLEIMKAPVEVLGGDQEDKEEKILNFLPKVLAAKLSSIMPSGFEIKEIEMKLSVGGKPFGVGLDAEALVRFGPKN